MKIFTRLAQRFTILLLLLCLESNSYANLFDSGFFPGNMSGNDSSSSTGAGPMQLGTDPSFTIFFATFTGLILCVPACAGFCYMIHRIVARSRGNEPRHWTPVDTSSLGQLPNEEICSICLKPLNENAGTESQPRDVVELPCQHRFDKECIATWAQRNLQCPICRAAFREPSAAEAAVNDRVNPVAVMPPEAADVAAAAEDVVIEMVENPGAQVGR